MKYTILSLALCTICLFISCAEEKDNAFGDYKSVNIKIEPENITEPLGFNQCTIDSVCPISLPDSINNFLPSKLMVKNNKIYLLDSDITKTILVFNIKGNYLYKLGERGRANDEYIGGPTDFFVDDYGIVYVFDARAQQIKIFKENGHFNGNLGVGDYFIYSFGLLNNKRLLYSIASNNRNEEDKAALISCDLISSDPRKLLDFKENYTFWPSRFTFFSNENRLSHIPLLSDSVIVFKGDSLEKIVHFDFDGKFMRTEKPELVTHSGSLKDIIDYNGVQVLRKYQETESLILLEYSYKNLAMIWLYNKRTKQTWNLNNLFEEGTLIPTLTYLSDNQIIALIEQEDVDLYQDLLKNPTEEYKKTLAKAPSQVRDVLEGRIKTPALFYITVK